jgi:hypothetical protein
VCRTSRAASSWHAARMALRLACSAPALLLSTFTPSMSAAALNSPSLRSLGGGWRLHKTDGSQECYNEQGGGWCDEQGEGAPRTSMQRKNTCTCSAVSAILKSYSHSALAGLKAHLSSQAAAHSSTLLSRLGAVRCYATCTPPHLPQQRVCQKRARSLCAVHNPY